MTAYALRLGNSQDTATRVRFGDALGLTPGGTALSARSGLRPDGGGVVTVTAGSMSVSVAPFAGWVDGTTADAQAGYPFFSDAAVALTLDAGDASLARVDTIVAQVRDNAFDGSGSTDARVLVVKGTPGAGAPALPATCVPLRDVNVPAGLSAGTGGLSSSNLGADRRKYVSGLGGVLNVASQAERDALTPQPGLLVFRLDTKRHEGYDGTGWAPLATDARYGVYHQNANTAAYANATWQANALSVTTDEASGITYSGGLWTVAEAGLYQVQASVSFPANATGIRGVRVTFGGTVQQNVLANASASFQTTVPLTATKRLGAGGTIGLDTYQSSGGSLAVAGDTGGTYTNVTIRRIVK